MMALQHKGCCAHLSLYVLQIFYKNPLGKKRRKLLHLICFLSFFLFFALRCVPSLTVSVWVQMHFSFLFSFFFALPPWVSCCTLIRPFLIEGQPTNNQPPFTEKKSYIFWPFLLEKNKYICANISRIEIIFYTVNIWPCNMYKKKLQNLILRQDF